MNIAIHKNRTIFSYRIFSLFISFSLIFTSIIPSIQAQPLLSNINLPVPGVMVQSTPNFQPALVKGIKLFPDNPLKFNFIVDLGESGLKEETMEQEFLKLIKYFLASLTTPEKDLWVNLSPYEKNRIIPESFGKTEMGRDLLAQDYLLKQLTASLMYPEEELGKNFWNAIYQKAYEKYGTTEISVNTFNKVWIMPEKAVVYVNGDVTYVVESRLKVMLEEDYLALENNKINFESYEEDQGSIQSDTKMFETEIIREIILPAIEKEVNEGAHFAQLRQIYHTMILATWYKINLQEGLLGKVYLDQNKIGGIKVEDENIKDKIYQQYLQAFKKGVYNYIREDYDIQTQESIPRKYFSGGFTASSPLFGSLKSKLKVLNKAVLSGAAGLFLFSSISTAEEYQVIVPPVLG
ncbi:hypothetical protein MNBD_UNCLBAC01-434 [hydrothermal vent metagenome]|uniref:Uncharacterized protein n=1 Tax=hydrothermal vent metagenome TaxID=652676 RepID=A0A3B1E4N3_9ZZZZ